MKPEASRLPAEIVAALLRNGLVLDRIIASGIWREFWESPQIEAMFFVNGVNESLDRVLDRIGEDE